jgi:hypothetical protein
MNEYLIGVLLVLAGCGVIGLIDVQFFQGRLGNKISAALPWTFKA